MGYKKNVESFLHFVFLHVGVWWSIYSRLQPDVGMVDNYEGVVPGSIVAVNLDGNYRPPHLEEVQQVDNTSFTVQWLKGGYKTK